MKIFAFALVATFIGVQVSSLTMKEIVANVETCNKESGVEEKYVKDVLEKQIVADNPKLKKDFVCFFKAIKVMDEEGNLDQAKLLEYFKVEDDDGNSKTDEEAKQLVKMCGKQKSNPEETAFELVKCEMDYEREKQKV